MIQRVTPRVSRYDFTDADLTKAKMFSQESLAYFEHQAADMVAELINIQFSPDPAVQQEQIYQYIATQSRYRFLMETLHEVQETYQALAAGDAVASSNPPSAF